ncbi:T9SS type A sorting domain-containing protein [Aequorivita marisscotiae]|uniref:T9SS type A sorting domain-containing protein n=1 Tax=Aequorivita marisscotiae TaxID=3040348 RepID=A0ABY8KWL3_9FLAO|nr:T9SS type A sorting domain-containing protein [Aequorivita sp. Ant34-E75]WGF93353.1 T9SS type A sorting domain-containing protein [Aequorivita sp. Ant34-E75]
MKYLIIIGCFIYSVFGYSQYTAIPDPNFENYLEQNGMGDGVPNNGQVLTSNINTVTELFVNNQNIGDLTGIEDFMALEYLGCAFNPLGGILDLSNNNQLIAIGCTSTDLTSLILPPSTNLEFLYCDENFLTELDLTQNPNLIEVYCEWNFLTSLDITQNTNLYLLWADHNEINGYFDTSNNVSITSLTIAYNNITALDLSHNVELISFGVSDNPLETLDARNGNNENIATFVATETTGQLKCILVDDASATYLDDWLIDPYTTFVNNQAECDALGVPTATLQDFTMHPNPATSTVAINLPNQGIEELVVTVANNLGQVLESKELLENTAVVPLDVSGYAAGVYFVTLKAGNDVTTKKLVVQ